MLEALPAAAARLIRLQDPAAAPALADLKERFPRGLSPFWEDLPSGFSELSALLVEAA
ncbi:MAG TPA: hypothetical protein VGX37_05710 [Allosphingosinicella sp.]|nr:hypothetical protein [Allosphingosinicella sp.]